MKSIGSSFALTKRAACLRGFGSVSGYSARCSPRRCRSTCGQCAQYSKARWQWTCTLGQLSAHTTLLQPMQPASRGPACRTSLARDTTLKVTLRSLSGLRLPRYRWSTPRSSVKQHEVTSCFAGRHPASPEGCQGRPHRRAVDSQSCPRMIGRPVHAYSVAAARISGRQLRINGLDEPVWSATFLHKINRLPHYLDAPL